MSVLYFFVLVFFSIAPVHAEFCHWSPKINEISSTTHARSTFYYDLLELEDEPVLWSEILTEDLGFQHFHAFIRSQMNPDPIFLIERQITIWEGIPRRHNIDVDGALRLFRLVISQSVSRIRPVNCLESLLMARQMERFSLVDTPSEMEAYVLKIKGDNGATKLRIHFTSGAHDYVTTLPEARQAIKDDLQRGWVLLFHIHNHPINWQRLGSERKQDIGGTPVPSGDRRTGDLSAFIRMKREYEAHAFKVTNGFDTFDLEAKNLELFISEVEPE